jgi:hypothetical protein
LNSLLMVARLQIRGTFFDGGHVDGKRNRLAREERLAAVSKAAANRTSSLSSSSLAEQLQRPNPLRQSVPSSKDKVNKESSSTSTDDSSTSTEDSSTSTDNSSTSADESASSEEEIQPDEATGDETRERMQLKELRSILERRVASRREEAARGSVMLGGVALPGADVHPLHMLLYGRSYHRSDSYSVVRGHATATHVHIGDAVAILDEPEESAFFLHQVKLGDAEFLNGRSTISSLSIFQHYPANGPLHGLRPCGGAAVWLPHRLRSVFPDENAEVSHHAGHYSRRGHTLFSQADTHTMLSGE